MSDVRYPGKMIDGVAVGRETRDDREAAADERQFQADEREQLARQRERRADERDAQADERERLADQRERAADLREAELDDRERELIERRQQLGAALEDLETRTLATIKRSRALLARSGERLNRHEEAVRRQQARRWRQQEEIDRASAETERGLEAWRPDPATAIERSRQLRQKVLMAIDAFAASEEQVARLHEDLAASQPGRHGEYRRVAEQARDTARKARGIFRSDTTGPQSHLPTAGLRPRTVQRGKYGNVPDRHVEVGNGGQAGPRQSRSVVSCSEELGWADVRVRRLSQVVKRYRVWL